MLDVLRLSLTMYVAFRMKDLSVLDSTPGVLYPKVVSIVNQEVFSLEVCKTYNTILIML